MITIIAQMTQKFESKLHTGNFDLIYSLIIYLTSLVLLCCSNGYVFTVRPELKITEKRDLRAESMGESRMKLLKLTKTNKSGVKDNFRALQVDVSGRNKL